MVEKKELSPEELYKKNQKKAKVLKLIAPFCFYGFLVLSVIFLVVAIRNSFGNVAEIIALLDNKNYTGEQLQNNYAYLVEKYGEWTIGNGGNGFTITFVNLGNALFSGVMLLSLIFSFVFFVCAFVLGKWLFPKIANQINEENQNMVNMTILKNQK